MDPEDGRSKLVHIRELYSEKLVIATSFNPATLQCTNCQETPHSVLEILGNIKKPCAFILSDQCFPPALPSSSCDCLAVIQVEDASLTELTTVFLKLTTGCDLPMGSAIIISSINHLGRVGSTAYAKDLVESLSSLRRTFGGQIRIIHGYPLPIHPIEDQVTIRSLLEIEAWLASVDPRRLHSLLNTSKHFVDALEAGECDKSNFGSLSIPLRLPASLHTKDRIAYVGLGWPQMTSRIPATSPEVEKTLLGVMLQELNQELALQLDTSPRTDRLCYTPEVNRRQVIIVGEGSHSCRLAEALGATHPEVVDLSIGGWRVNEDNARDLANDISDALEATECLEDVTVILNLFDNSIYKRGCSSNPSEPLRLNGSYHLAGRLNIVSEDNFKSLF